MRADAYYHVRAERGVLEAAPGADRATLYRGADLLSLAAEELGDATSLAAAKRLLRSALEAPLEGRELNTRTVARAVQAGRVRGAESTGDGGNGES